MAEPSYTIRYRQHTPAGIVALLVEDDGGRLYVYTGRRLHPYLRRPAAPERRAATLRDLGWSPVPTVAPYTLAGLRRLLRTSAAA